MKEKPVITKVAIFVLWLGCFSVSTITAQISPTCFAPGSVVVSDDTSILILPQHDIEKVYAAEPLFSDGSEQSCFDIRSAAFTPTSRRFLEHFFHIQAGTIHFVQMSTLAWKSRISIRNGFESIRNSDISIIREQFLVITIQTGKYQFLR